MKILISAFACRPNSGSETGVGWRWAIELAKKHEVVVLTDITRKAEIDAELAIRPITNLQFAFYRPFWIKWLPLNSKTAQLLYCAWQYLLLPFGCKLQKKYNFDLVIHLTYGVFRHPSFLGFVGPPFIFGPVGGGEDAPWRLKRSLPLVEKIKELLRSLMNLLAAWNPFLWLALSRADCILVKTIQTAKVLPLFVRSEAVEYQEIGIDTSLNEVKLKQRDITKPLSLLFVGRLLGWKGVHFAIRGLAESVSNGVEAQLTIVGAGQNRKSLERIAEKAGVKNHVKWLGVIPQQVLLQKYAEFDAFIFPSLHDSSGNAVLEALAGGLPVICLDIGGPATLVSEDCALVLSTVDADEVGLVSRVADAITTLATNEERRLLMSKAALKKAKEMSWENRVNGALEIFQSRRQN